MTKTEALTKMDQLRKNHCICNTTRLKVAFHDSKCPYRMQAWMPPDLRPFAGSLYNVAIDPELYPVEPEAAAA